MRSSSLVTFANLCKMLLLLSVIVISMVSAFDWQDGKNNVKWAQGNSFKNYIKLFFCFNSKNVNVNIDCFTFIIQGATFTAVTLAMFKMCQVRIAEATVFRIRDALISLGSMTFVT